MIDSIQPAPLRGVVVIPREFEQIDSLVRRFKKVTDRSGVLRDYRSHEYHIRKGQRLRMKRLQARRRRSG